MPETKAKDGPEHDKDKSNVEAVSAATGEPYILEEQVGFLLRKAQQRHTAIFSEEMPEKLTPTQHAALVKLKEVGACSQNHLGRLTAMDVATIKGVVDRLKGRGLVQVKPVPSDRRRALIDLTDMGRGLVAKASIVGKIISEKTLDPLKANERATLLSLLAKISK